MWKNNVNIKWRDCGGDVFAAFGVISGYTVCVVMHYATNKVGISFCCPADRPFWSREKGIDLALARLERNGIQYRDNFSVEDYVVAATYQNDPNYVPQAIRDSVRSTVSLLPLVSREFNRSYTRKIVESVGAKKA